MLYDSPYVDQPREVSIETFAFCNAACRFCPYPTLERQGTRMTDHLVGRLIEEMTQFKYPFFFSPFKVNEPFLNRRLQSICETFDKTCLKGSLRLFTNGSALTVRHIDWIRRLRRVEHLWVSLNSTDPKEYEDLMQLKYERTAERLDVLHDFVIGEKTARLWTHKVVVSKVADDDHGKNLRFHVECLQRWPAFQSIIIKRDGWLGYVEPNSSLIPSGPCARWFELSILATGVAALCCMDGEGKYAIGNVHDKSLLEIYNETSFKQRRLRMCSRKSITPCNQCTY